MDRAEKDADRMRSQSSEGANASAEAAADRKSYVQEVAFEIWKKYPALLNDTTRTVEKIIARVQNSRDEMNMLNIGRRNPRMISQSTIKRMVIAASKAWSGENPEVILDASRKRLNPSR